MAPGWVLEIRDQCQAARVPFFCRQCGGVGRSAAGRLLEGKVWEEMPETRHVAVAV